MKILGIDPGSRKSGWSIIEKKSGECKYINSGKVAAGEKLSFDARLEEMYNHFVQLIAEFKPDYVAIETVFVKVNPKVSIQLSQLLGVVVLAATQKKIPVMYVTTTEAKKYVVGHSRATKEEVAQKIVEYTKKQGLKKVTLDETDAVAVGFTAASRLNESVFSF